MPEVSLCHILMPVMASPNQNPEQLARDRIARDRIGRGQRDAGWEIPSRDAINVSASPRVTVAELQTTKGPADSTLFVDGRPVQATNEEGEQEKQSLTYNRQDFCATTSNKQLNFVLHIHDILEANGQAAVVVPDNVLFEGDAGETVRRKLLETTDLHTILRLSTGIFCAQGVKANVIFFDNKPAARSPWKKEVWCYDLRTNSHFTLKANPVSDDDLADFVTCYRAGKRHKRSETWSDENPEGRWRRFSYD